MAGGCDSIHKNRRSNPTSCSVLAKAKNAAMVMKATGIGQAVAELAIPLIKSRRLIASSEAQDMASCPQTSTPEGGPTRGRGVMSASLIGRGRNPLEQLQHFPKDTELHVGEASDASRMREVGNETLAERIDDRDKHDRDGAGLIAQSSHDGAAVGQDHIG